MYWEARILAAKLTDQRPKPVTETGEDSLPSQEAGPVPSPLPPGESFFKNPLQALKDWKRGRNSLNKDLTGIPMVLARWPFNWMSGGKKEIPLYTSPLGKPMLKSFSKITGTAIEIVRGARDRALEAWYRADLDPEITVVDTAGLTVTLAVPALQLATTGTTQQRLNLAQKDLLETGNFSVKPKLPPGSKKINGTMIPTPSPDDKVGDGIKRAKGQTDHLLRLNPNWPIAKLEFAAGAADQALLMLEQKGLLSETDAAQAHLFHSLSITAEVQGLDRQGNLVGARQKFPLGNAPLEFDASGKVKTSAYEVGGILFHPALLGLDDFAALMSAKLGELTGNAVTIAPETAVKALMLAPFADKDTEKIILGYINRMQAIDTVGLLLNRNPGELFTSLWRAVNIVDHLGSPHRDTDEIFTAIMGSLLGFEDLPEEVKAFGRPTTYVSFVNFMYQLFKKADAYVEFSGNPKAITQAVENARDLPELMELLKKMGVANPEKLRGDLKPKPMNIAQWLSFEMTPIVLRSSALAIKARNSVNARLIDAEARMELHRIVTIDGVREEIVRLDKAYWENVFKKTLAEIAKIDPSAKAKETTDAVIAKIKAKYEAAKNTEDIIDGKAKPVQPQIPAKSGTVYPPTQPFKPHFIKPSDND